MDISLDSIAETIEAFIRSEFQVAAADPMFTRDVHLFEVGFMDSAGFAELLAFIEADFGVAIDEEEMFSEEVTTINGISRVVFSHLRER